MSLLYEQSRDHYYGVREIKESQGDELEIQMLRHNRIHGLVPASILRGTGTLKIRYDISGLLGLGTKTEQGELNFLVLDRLIFDILQTAAWVEKYLLRSGGICLDPEEIFWNPKKEEFSFCYHPVREAEGQEANQLKPLAQWLITHIDHKDRRGTEAAYRIYDYCTEPYPVLGGLGGCLLGSGYTGTTAAKQGPALLSQDPGTCPDFFLQENPFLIGKNLKELAGIPTVSRKHARIDREENCFYITDLHSTNGTWLNHERIRAEERYRIQDGDKIGIAALEFIFRQ